MPKRSLQRSSDSSACLRDAKRLREAQLTASAASPPLSVQVQQPAAPEEVHEVGEVKPDFDWLIVGLGNPGATYANTRHNIGFKVVETLAAREGIDCRKLDKSAAVGKGQLHGQKVLLAKPMTFMNNSGESVRALAQQHRIPVSRILVISDDLDQPTAGIKLKPKGGHGGHNGLRSIIDCVGRSDFPRLKIGIGRPPALVPVPTYVLQDFDNSETEAVQAAINECVEIVSSVVGLGLDKAVSGVRLAVGKSS